MDACAEKGPSAHESGQSGAPGGEETLQRTRGRPERSTWVRKELPAHTGEARVKVLGTIKKCTGKPCIFYCAEAKWLKDA